MLYTVRINQPTFDSGSTSAIWTHYVDLRSVNRPTIDYYQPSTDNLIYSRSKTIGISELPADAHSDLLPTYHYYQHIVGVSAQHILTIMNGYRLRVTVINGNKQSTNFMIIAR